MDDKQIKDQLTGFWQTTGLPLLRKYGFLLAVAVAFFLLGVLVGCAQAAEPECKNYFVNQATGKKVCFDSAPPAVVERVYTRAADEAPPRYTSTIYNPTVNLPVTNGSLLTDNKAYDRSGYERGVTYTVNTNTALGVQTRTPIGSATGRPTEVYQYRR